MAASSMKTKKAMLEKFPTDIAVELKEFAKKHSLHCAKKCQGKGIKAYTDKSKADQHLTSFKMKCTGVLSEITCQEIEKMLQNAGWHAANTMKSKTYWRQGNRIGYKNDASNNKWEVEEHCHNILLEEEMSEDLVNNVRDMGWGAAWFAANTIFGHQKEADRQREILNKYFDMIHGEVTVTDILSQRSHEDSEHFAPTLGDIGALESLPFDVADELKGYAEKAAWHCSKMLFGDRGEADTDRIKANNHYESFKEKCKGLLSDKSREDVRSMLWNAASYAANETKRKKCWFTKRNHYKANASSDEKEIEKKFQDVVNEGEITKTLARNVKEMGMNAAWFAAHTIVGRDDDAMLNQAKLDWHFMKMRGEINLVAMNFIMDEAKILSEKPKVVSVEDLLNNTDTEQAMMFRFSVTEGKTHSTSLTIGFCYGIRSGFKAGFSGFGEANFELSFSFSHSHTFEQSVSTGITKSVEFPLSVPAHSTYIARGMVSEAEMEIPYELVFDFGGAHRKLRGHWKGVACSKATYQVDKKEHPSQGPQPAEENEHPSPTPTPVEENGSTSYCNLM